MSNVAEKLNSGYFDVVCKGKYNAFAAQKGRRKIAANEIFIESQIDSYGAVEGFRSFFTEKLNCGPATVSRVTSKLADEGKIEVKRLPNGKTEYRSARNVAQEERKDPFYRIYNFFFTHEFEFNFEAKKDEQGKIVKPARTVTRTLTQSEVLVLALIFTHSSNKNCRKARFWGSYAKIGELLELSERQVERVISNLRAARLIFRHVVGQNRVRQSKYTANMKVLRVLIEQYSPKKEKKAETVSEKPAYVEAADAKTDIERYYAKKTAQAQTKAEDYKRKFLIQAPSYAIIEKDIRDLQKPLAMADLYNLPTLGELLAKERAMKAQAAELCQRFNVDPRLFDAGSWARCKKCSDTGQLPNGLQCSCYKGKV